MDVDTGSPAAGVRGSGGTEFLRRFGLRLKVLRVQRGLTQEQVADLAGMHRTFIGQVERGESGMNVDRLPDLARALGVDIPELFLPM